MIRRLLVCRARGDDPYENLAVEQALLEAVEPETCVLYLWQNRHTVVIGRNQNPWQECRCTLLEEEGGKLARRLSGGGAVYHDLGNLNFTFLLREEDYDLERQLSVVIGACRRLSIPAQRSGRNDVLYQDRKFSGNAFYSHQGRRYHHGTLLVNADTAAVGRYLSPSPAKLQAKGVASVRSRVINLCEICPGLTVEEMAQCMEEEAQAVYRLPAEQLPINLLSRRRVEELRRRNAGWEWRYGQPLPFTAQCAQRFDWGELTVQIQADRGLIQEAAVYSDAMDWTLAPALRRALSGCPLTAAALEERLSALPLERHRIQDLLRALEKLL